jgi:hypothetical protein
MKRGWRRHSLGLRVKRPPQTEVVYPNMGVATTGFPLGNPNCCICDRPHESIAFGAQIRLFERHVENVERFDFISKEWSSIRRCREEMMYFCRECATLAEIVIMLGVPTLRKIHVVQP